MADTGAPWNIPFAEPTDLVRDWPELSEDVANAVAAGLDGAGGLVAVKHVLKTDTFVSGSVSGGANVAVPDLEITHEVADPANRLIISAFFGAASGTFNQNAVGIAVHDGTNLIGIGDASGNRTRVGAGGRVVFTPDNRLSIPLSVTFVHTPGAGSKTYTVRIINVTSSSQTLYVGRTPGNANDENTPAAASGFVIQEVKV